jgi:hypothetical protein
MRKRWMDRCVLTPEFLPKATWVDSQPDPWPIRGIRVIRGSFRSVLTADSSDCSSILVQNPSKMPFTGSLTDCWIHAPHFAPPAPLRETTPGIGWQPFQSFLTSSRHYTKDALPNLGRRTTSTAGSPHLSFARHHSRLSIPNHPLFLESVVKVWRLGTLELHLDQGLLGFRG